MNLSAKLNSKHFTFKGVKEVLAKANEEKSGDMLAGIGAESASEAGWRPNWCSAG